ncbi:MAG: cation diffusion facilitator family transporter [Anaerolineaceae bacterium]|nr:cation diffusion facilitator family transporter [Anaerolineaceae bacterium]
MSDVLQKPGRSRASDGAEALDDRQRYVLGRRAAWISIVGNILLAAAKGLLASVTGSISLWGDAVHSASDLITSLIVLVGLRIGRRPADARHPYGHGRAEIIATLAVGILLALAGLQLGYKSVQRILNPPEIGEALGRNLMIVIAAGVLLSAAAKEWMARYSARVGRRIGNPSLKADAWHHRSDALSSVLVAVSLGGAALGYYRLDAFLGLGVCLLIMISAVRPILRSASSLLGEAPQEELVAKIKAVAQAVHGVKNIHAVTVHDYGHRKVASMHVTLQAELNLDQAHRVASEVESQVTQQLGLSVLVHAEPHSEQPTDFRRAGIREAVRGLLTRHASIVSFHALSILPEDHGLEVEFNVHIAPGTPIETAHRLEHDLGDLMVREVGDLHVHVHVEPCQLNCRVCPDTCGVRAAEPANDSA